MVLTYFIPMINLVKTGITQLDHRLQSWQKVRTQEVPSGGWIRAIRQSLGLTGVALARRIGITQASLHDLESSEANGKVTIKSLRKAAAAMDCELVYAIVPRTTLSTILQERAREKAHAVLARIGQNMKLESQEVAPSKTSDQTQALIETLLENPKLLWK